MDPESFIVHLHHNNQTLYQMQIRQLPYYSATADQKAAARLDFMNIMKGLGFTVQVPDGQAGMTWPTKFIINGANVICSHSHEKLSLATTQYKSKGDGSMSVNIKFGELIPNPKRLKAKLTEIVSKCAEQDRVENERKSKVKEVEDRAALIEAWVKLKVNNNCKAWRYSGDMVEIEIRTPQNNVDYKIVYNVKTSDYSVSRNPENNVSVGKYDQFTQTRLDLLKKEVEQYQLALDLAQDLITKMNLDQIL